ncbi:MAG: translation initiation factor IF-6 [Nanoarchaeota archaeon]|nr:translation initiation factor IF-6 [Nanoarchaeota archaeon]
MKAFKTNIDGNPNIGLFAFCNDKICLVGNRFTKPQIRKMEDVLGVHVEQISVAGTDLIGAFVAGNNKCILVPDLIFPEELEKLMKIKEIYGNAFDVKVIGTKLTALGNNILANDSGCLVNPDFPATQKKLIRQALGVKVVPGMIAEHNVVGSLGVAVNTGACVHEDVCPEEQGIIEKLLNVPVVSGTINRNPYVRSGVIVNSNGYVVGDQSKGDELLLFEEIFQK